MTLVIAGWAIALASLAAMPICGLLRVRPYPWAPILLATECAGLALAVVGQLTG